jgi:hypothetical protein
MPVSQTGSAIMLPVTWFPLKISFRRVFLPSASALPDWYSKTSARAFTVQVSKKEIRANKRVLVKTGAQGFFMDSPPKNKSAGCGCCGRLGRIEEGLQAKQKKSRIWGVWFAQRVFGAVGRSETKRRGQYSGRS